MKSYDYILFDWDGCLARSLEVWLRATKGGLAQYGSHPPDRDVVSHFGDWELPKYFGVEDVSGCIDVIVRLADQDAKSVELYDGAKDMLLKLKQHKKLALLSTARRDVLDSGLAHNGLENMFDFTLSADEAAKHKPDPEVILRALDFFEGGAENAIMVGDSRKDIVAAHNARVDCILYYPSSHAVFYDLELLKNLKPTHIISHFNELETIIR